MARSSDLSFFMAILRDKTFQAREIRRVIYLATLYLVVTTVMLGVFYHMLLGNLVSGSTPLFFVSEDMQRFNELMPGLATVLGRWIIVMMVVNVIITACVGVYITRKLGQPILAIKRALRDIGNGDLNVRLRETDDREFSDISIALNNAMAQIRMHILTAKQEFSTLQDLKNSAAANDDENELEVVVENCAAALDFFSVHEEQGEDEDVQLNRANEQGL